MISKIIIKSYCILNANGEMGFNGKIIFGKNFSGALWLRGAAATNEKRTFHVDFTLHSVQQVSYYFCDWLSARLFVQTQLI